MRWVCSCSSSRPGGKVWRVKYRVDGREKKLGVGTYPEISLAELASAAMMRTYGGG
jgi:hypothetical protein